MSPLKLLVASTNPVKINAAKLAFEKIFPGQEFEIEGVSVPSGVADQPMGTEETLTGAKNRALGLRELHPEADFVFGLEGGLITDEHNQLVSQAWMVVIDKHGKLSQAATATFTLPKPIAELIHGGMELGHATDKLYGLINSKHSGSTVAVLTDDIITRTTYYEHALVLALIPFKYPELY
jgi:inosine/xanthosine triphosphatase